GGEEVDGGELRIQVEGDLDLLLDRGQEGERARDALRLPPARGVRRVPEVPQRAPGGEPDDALGGLAPTVVGGELLLGAGGAHVAPEEAHLGEPAPGAGAPRAGPGREPRRGGRPLRRETTPARPPPAGAGGAAPAGDAGAGSAPPSPRRACGPRPRAANRRKAAR